MTVKERLLGEACEAKRQREVWGAHMAGLLHLAALGQGAGRLGQDEAGQQDDEARGSCAHISHTSEDTVCARAGKTSIQYML